MRNYYSADQKMVIHCGSCLNKLRVPLDKGKISVSCPVCKRNFIYNPNSILDTLKQIAFSAKAFLRKLPKKQRNLLFILAGILLALIIFIYLFSGLQKPKNRDENSEQVVYYLMQESLNKTWRG